MKVVVTGADGFIGRHLTKSLGAANHTALDLGPASEIDVRNTNQVRTRLSALAPDLIVHLAAVSGPMLHQEEPEVVMAINGTATVNVLESARRLGGVPVILAGSVSGYTRGTLEHSRPASVYGVTKRCTELLADVYREEFGLTCTTVRIGSVYGAGRHTAHVLDVMIENAAAGIPVSFSTAGWEPLVHVRDAGALLAALVGVPHWRAEYDLVTTPASHEVLARTVCDLVVSGSEPVAEDQPAYAWSKVFDSAGLYQDTGCSHAVELREGIKELVDRHGGRPI